MIAFIIVSFNAKRYMQECIQSIRDKVSPGTYGIVVVDNASTDGIAEWLSVQPDILFIRNKVNVGFGPGCNQAVKATMGTELESADIFLLNNDTVMTSTAVPRMTAVLDSSDDIGAVGAMSSYAGNRQQYNVEFGTTDEYVHFGENLQIQDGDNLLEKVRLNGFAMLIRRSVWNEIGGFDEDFAPGYYEDDAISIEILKKGYRLFLERGSFIYHVGSASFVKTSTNTLSAEHHQLFIQKYGFDILNYAYPCGAVMSQIPFGRDDSFKVLHVGCGLGAELKAIRSLFPKTKVYGIETNPKLYSIANKTEIIYPSVNEARKIINENFFDLLIIDSNSLDSLCDEEKSAIASMCTPEAVEILRMHEYDTTPFDEISLIIWDQNIYDKKAADSLANWGIMSSVYESDNLAKRIKGYNLPVSHIMFITDNHMLRTSAFFIEPNAHFEDITIVPYMLAHFGRLPVTDQTHKKNHELEIFEKKVAEEKSFVSHEAFINNSNLQTSCNIAYASDTDKILEFLSDHYKLGLIDKPLSKSQLMRLITNKWNDCSYINAKDKYADYGIVGFVCHNRRSQETIYDITSWLLDKEDIQKCMTPSANDSLYPVKPKDNSIQILLKGNENLHPIEDYLVGGSVTTEYDKPFDCCISPLPSLMYESPFHIIIFSCIQEDYSSWEADGNGKLSLLFDTLEKICSECLGSPTTILLLGYESEIPISNLNDGILAELHHEINPIIRDFASDHPNIRTININDFIHTSSDFDGSVNKYITKVYSDIVEQIVLYINEKVDEILSST